MAEWDDLSVIEKSPAFPATQWTRLSRLRQGLDGQEREQILAQLCRGYWYPLYAYARRLGLSAQDAEDATQMFFEKALSRDFFEHADRDKGKLRTFLLTSMERLIFQVREKQRTVKRGGDSPHLSLDAMSAEDRYQSEGSDNSTPDKLFERQWAMEILNATLKRLGQAYAAEGKSSEFSVLKSCVELGADGVDQEQAAAALGIPGSNLRVRIHRLRREYGRLLREEVAATMHHASTAEVDDELKELRAALH